MRLRLLELIAVTVFVSSCSPVAHRGSVAMKISENEAHVCLGQNEVTEGDRVVILRNVCKPDSSLGSSKPGRRIPGKCELVRVGGGVIKDTLNEHYSVATIDAGVEYREGDIVEKLK